MVNSMKLIQSMQSLTDERDVLKCQAKEKETLICNLEKEHDGLSKRFIALVSKEKQVQEQLDGQKTKSAALELKASGLDDRIALLAAENCDLKRQLDSVNITNLELGEEYDRFREASKFEE